MFSQIGVEVEFSGSVCENRKIAACMNAILRECVTNAVRHGFASSVKAKYAHIPNGWRLTVSDNGEGSEYIIEARRHNRHAQKRRKPWAALYA